MADPFANYTSGLDSPAANAADVSPSNSADLPTACRALWVGGAGNVKVTTVSGQTVTFTAVPAGTMLPVRCSRVWADSTATSMEAVW